MKRKSRNCSTGHGRGVTPFVELRTILDRDQYRIRRKQARRADKRPGTVRNLPGGVVLDERGRTVPSDRGDYIRKGAPAGDLNGFWLTALLRRFDALLGRRGEAKRAA